MSEDLFVPTSSPDDALVSQLHTITYVTGNRDAVESSLMRGLDMESSGWIMPNEKDRRQLNDYYSMPATSTWDACRFFRTGDAANVQIRVIAMRETTAVVRPSIDGRYLGGLSIGFPMTDLHAHEAKMNALGVEASVGVKKMEFTGPDGEVYVSAEIHFMAEDNVFLLGVARPDVFVPVGPIDAATGIGAPAYSARCVDNPNEVMRFMESVLGFEIRRDATFSVANPSGLRLTEGMSERFIQAFAPGASSGYLVLLDHAEENKPSPAATVGPPSRGMSMWTLPTKDIDTVHANALAAGSKILHAPAERASLFLPITRTMMLEDPAGFPIEIFAEN